MITPPFLEKLGYKKDPNNVGSYVRMTDGIGIVHYTPSNGRLTLSTADNDFVFIQKVTKIALFNFTMLLDNVAIQEVHLLRIKELEDSIKQLQS